MADVILLLYQTVFHVSKNYIDIQELSGNRNGDYDRNRMLLLSIIGVAYLLYLYQK